MFHMRTIALLATASVFIAGCTPSRPPYPPTDKRPVTDSYHGANVVDDYRWLDDQNDKAVASWVAAQNAFSRSVLDKVNARGAIAGRLKQLHGQKSVSYDARFYRGKLFVTKYQPPKEQPFLVVIDSPDDLSSEQTVLDPNTLDTSGATSIDFYVPSRDGKLVAVSLSRGGSEDGTASVYESGASRGSFGPYATGDVFRVALEGGVIKYRKNGTLFDARMYVSPLVDARGQQTGGLAEQFRRQTIERRALADAARIHVIQI